MQTIDKEINEILNRAEEYRKKFQKNEEKEEVIKSNLSVDLGDIVKQFFSNIDTTDENSVFIKYKIKKADLENGIIKNLKYKVVDKNNRKIKKVISIKLTKKILKEQTIVISGCGNYIQAENRYSNLIITLINKNGGEK